MTRRWVVALAAIAIAAGVSLSWAAAGASRLAPVPVGGKGVTPVTDPTCGDGVVNPAEKETCDPPGSPAGGNGNLCRGDCTVCGDGVHDEGRGEECDDANGLDEDGCRNNCSVPRCGDGIVDVQLGETCDDGNRNDGDGCSSKCVGESKCGDGVLDPGEECDDGNNVDGDGCSAQCLIEKCGNGVLDAGEECDDGNNMDGDGCSAECLIEKCGNGVLDAGEECDDGNNMDGDGCSSDCRREKPRKEGCTPGFWKNHTRQWVGYAPDEQVGAVFTAAARFPTLADDSILEALRYRGGTGDIGGARILLRAAVAALLNEAHPGVGYSVDGVIDRVNAALDDGRRDTMLGLAGHLDGANNGPDGCPLSGSKKTNGFDLGR